MTWVSLFFLFCFFSSSTSCLWIGKVWFGEALIPWGSRKCISIAFMALGAHCILCVGYFIISTCVNFPQLFLTLILESLQSEVGDVLSQCHTTVMMSPQRSRPTLSRIVSSLSDFIQHSFLDEGHICVHPASNKDSSLPVLTYFGSTTRYQKSALPVPVPVFSSQSKTLSSQHVTTNHQGPSAHHLGHSQCASQRQGRRKTHRPFQITAAVSRPPHPLRGPHNDRPARRIQPDARHALRDLRARETRHSR